MRGQQNTFYCSKNAVFGKDYTAKASYSSDATPWLLINGEGGFFSDNACARPGRPPPAPIVPHPYMPVTGPLRTRPPYAWQLTAVRPVTRAQVLPGRKL